MEPVIRELTQNEIDVKVNDLKKKNKSLCDDGVVAESLKREG